MPRRPIGDHPMTDAERQRRRRERLRQEKLTAEVGGHAEPIAQEQRIWELETELAVLRDRIVELEMSRVAAIKPVASTEASTTVVRPMSEREKGERESVRQDVEGLLRLHRRDLPDGIYETVVGAFMAQFDDLKGISIRHGISRRTYRKILAMLHPDRAPAAKATFIAFKELEKKLVVAEAVKNTMPRTVEEMMECREQVRQRNSTRARAAATKRRGKTL